jgi:hypothetical protein
VKQRVSRIPYAPKWQEQERERERERERKSHTVQSNGGLNYIQLRDKLLIKDKETILVLRKSELLS